MEGKVALITGSEGFVGYYLQKYLQNEGAKVHGFDLKSGKDIRNYDHVRVAVDEIEPDYIFHLAALAYVPESGTDYRRGIETNVLGTVNVLEAVRQTGIRASVLLAGTSEEYGYQGHQSPVTEETIPKPTTLYGMSKLAAGEYGLTYSRIYGFPVVVTRAYNHIGAGQSHRYAVSAFARRIVEVEKKHRKVVEHGNLEAVRNYSSVLDIVRAYALAVKQPSGVFNLCSKDNVSAQEIMNRLIELAECSIETKIDESLYRPASKAAFPIPSCAKFTKATGWFPYVPLDKTLSDILDYWRAVL